MIITPTEALLVCAVLVIGTACALVIILAFAAWHAKIVEIRQRHRNVEQAVADFRRERRGPPPPPSRK